MRGKLQNSSKTGKFGVFRRTKSCFSETTFGFER